jgi:phage FluMu gp28-like protein
MTDIPQLLPYQSQFLTNPARFKIGLWARQTGKDFTCTCEAVLDCLRTPKTTWLIVAAGERQALESLEKTKEWAEIFKRPIHEFTGPSSTARARANSAQIKWSNGSRIIALPANPNTIRGYSANLILTEFAFHEDPDAVWRAVYPSISNPLRGGVKKVRIISTPNGLSNKFAQLWLDSSTLSQTSLAAPERCRGGSQTLSNSAIPSSAAKSTYFRSRITIHDAVTAGLALDPDELRRGLNDPEAWAQEYLCEFADNSTVLFPYELIEASENNLATETSSIQSLSVSGLPNNPNAPHLYAGIDFARKNHLTVCWIIERVPNPNLTPAPTPTPLPSMPNEKCSTNNAQWIFLTREVLTLQNLSTPDQIQTLLPRLQRCQRICVDYTGPGIGFGDYLQKELSTPNLNPNLNPFRN